jgi:hypothetical protein
MTRYRRTSWSNPVRRSPWPTLTAVAYWYQTLPRRLFRDYPIETRLKLYSGLLRYALKIYVDAGTHCRSVRCDSRDPFDSSVG